MKCPNCGGDMELPVDALGGHVRCPYCNARSSAEVVVRPLDGMGGVDDAMKLNTVRDAERDFDESCEKLGQYYCSKAMERARFDLREASKYFEMVCKWGNETALAAFCQKFDGVEGESIFPALRA